MAKTVGDLLVKLKAEGLENVAALKSALRKLGEASASSDKQLLELKKDILEVARAGKSSRQSIKGQIDALKGLRDQATLGGSAFKQFSKDVAEYEAKLKAVDAQIDSTGKKLATLRQLESRFTGRTVEGVEKQIASRRQLLDTLKPLTAEYAKQLGNVNALEKGVSRALARQQVVASAQMQATVRFARGGDVTGGPGTFASALTQDLGKLPQTINALNLELGELKTDLKDLDITSDDYRETQARILELEEKLKKATDSRTQSVIDQERRLKKLDETEERRARRAAKVAGIQAALSGRRGNTLEIGSRDTGTGAIIAGGTAPVQPYVPPQVREISELYRGISDIGMAGISADIDRMGKSYEEVARDIKAATLASNGSINSLQAQRASWASLRAGLSPTSKAYQDVSRQIEAVDRRLEKLNRRRRRPTLGGAASVLGGIAAGGVFGGPEGAIGGALGSFGGVQGVAAGAALGAQVKTVREALGATSEYAAELQKLQIALEGVAKSDYPAAMRAAARVTEELNVPQEVAIKGMTRLTAAVVGAGGNVADAEVVFRNVTAAIKATGGGAQDVESAITAMVQTFSKGKVSAEELSGQLGERLPGAVTKFAEANDMTLPQLQAAFKAGTVGLDELMTFIISLGPEYAKIAAEIADSSADAGARAQVAFNKVKIAIGEALQPVGAQMQKAFAEFITDIAPALVSAAKAAATGLNLILDVGAFLVKNFEEIASAALVLGSAVGAAGLAKAAITAGGAMNVLKLALFDVKLAVAGLGKALAFLAANPIVLLVAGVTAAGVALYRAATANDRFVKSIDDGKTTLEEANEKAQDMNDEINTLQERLNKTSNKRLMQSLKRQLRSAYEDVEDLNNAIERSIYREFGAGKDFVGPVLPGSSVLDERSYNRTNFDDPDADDDSGSGAARVMMTQAELDLRDKIRQARLDENKFLESSLTYELDILTAQQETEDALARTNAIQQAGFDLIVRGRELRQERADEAEREAEAEARKNDRIQQARVLAGEITQEEYNRAKTLKEMEVLLAGMPELLEKIKQKLNETSTPLQSFKDGVKKIFEEAMNLRQALADAGVQAVQKFGDAFADFVATGKSSFKEMTASILQDLARIFARAALFKTLSLIPGVGGFLGLGAKNGAVFNGPGTNPPVTMPDSVSLMAANGAAFAKNKIVPYAKGGLVTKPTLFQYANGGTGNFGIMGEAGPEAILPLKKGPGGKLGVHSSGAGASNIVVNVDASGSNVQGDGQQGKALGQAIGAAVQAELIKQKMPGGLLS